MTATTRPRTSVGVSITAAFYFFGAIVLLVGLVTNSADVSRTIADAHGLPPAADAYILPMISSLALLMAYGLFAGKRWGYLLSLAYLFIFGSVSLWLAIQRAQQPQPYLGNTSWSFLALIYLIWKRKDFFRKG